MRENVMRLYGFVEQNHDSKDLKLVHEGKYAAEVWSRSSRMMAAGRLICRSRMPPSSIRFAKRCSGAMCLPRPNMAECSNHGLPAARDDDLLAGFGSRDEPGKPGLGFADREGRHDDWVRCGLRRAIIAHCG